MKNKITDFDKAYQELQQIAKELDDHSLPVEKLAMKVERAAELTLFCKNRLRKIEDELNTISDMGQSTEEKP